MNECFKTEPRSVSYYRTDETLMETNDDNLNIITSLTAPSPMIYLKEEDFPIYGLERLSPK